MLHLKPLKVFCLLILVSSPVVSIAQSKEHDYVPCEEMPNLMQHYAADSRALSRYYSPMASGASRGPGGGDGGVGSHEKRGRLEKLNNEYLKKLEQVNFKNLPQECKVDYILFKRDLKEKLRQSAQETTE